MYRDGWTYDGTEVCAGIGWGCEDNRTFSVVSIGTFLDQIDVLEQKNALCIYEMGLNHWNVIIPQRVQHTNSFVVILSVKPLGGKSNFFVDRAYCDCPRVYRAWFLVEFCVGFAHAGIGPAAFSCKGWKICGARWPGELFLVGSVRI